MKGQRRLNEQRGNIITGAIGTAMFVIAAVAGGLYERSWDPVWIFGTFALQVGAVTLFAIALDRD